MERIRKKLILFCVNHFLSGTHFFRLKKKLLNCLRDVQLGNNVRIVGPLYISGSLVVGDNTWLGHDLRIEGNGSVTISENCDIAPLVVFYTGSHKIGDSRRRAGEGITKNIIVKSGCWIGGSTIILPGVVVNEGAVIAAGSVISKDVEKNKLVGGQTTRVIRDLDN